MNTRLKTGAIQRRYYSEDFGFTRTRPVAPVPLKNSKAKQNKNVLNLDTNTALGSSETRNIDVSDVESTDGTQFETVKDSVVAYRKCVCNRFPGNLEIVTCDNVDCEFEYFHLNCVNLDELPKGNWYCSFCLNDKKNENDKTLDNQKGTMDQGNFLPLMLNDANESEFSLWKGDQDFIKTELEKNLVLSTHSNNSCTEPILLYSNVKSTQQILDSVIKTRVQRDNLRYRLKDEVTTKQHFKEKLEEAEAVIAAYEFQENESKLKFEKLYSEYDELLTKSKVL